MDVLYLQEHVGSLLSAGVAATLHQNPLDPVDFLARWLLHAKQSNRAQQQQREATAAQLKEDEQRQRQQAAALQQRQAQRSEQASRETAQQQQLAAFLSSHSELSSFFPTLFSLLSPLLSEPAMYAALCSSDTAPNDCIRYVAATEADSMLLSRKLTRAEGGGCLFSLFPEAEEQEAGKEEEEEGEAAGRPQAAARVFPSLSVENVLLPGPAGRVKLWRREQVGSFYAVKLSIDSLRSEETLEDALDKLREREEKRKEEAEEAARKESEKDDAAADGDPAEEEEEEEEVDEDDAEAVAARDKRRAEKEAAKLNPPKPETEEEKAEREEKERQAKAEREEAELVQAVAKRRLQYALCLDTVGLGRRLGEAEKATLAAQLPLILDALVRLDRADFVREREAFAAFTRWQQQRQAAEAEKAADGAALEEEEKAERERIAAEKKAASLPSSPQDVDYAFHTARLQAVQEGLELLRQTEILRGGAVGVYQSALLVLGFPSEQCGDWDGAAQWRTLRERFDAEFWSRLAAYEPRAQVGQQWTETAGRLKRWLAEAVGEGAEERLKEKNAVSVALLGWLRAVQGVKARVKKEVKDEQARQLRLERERKEKEEEEERKRKEAEEAAKEAEEAEQADGADNGEEEEGEDA